MNRKRIIRLISAALVVAVLFAIGISLSGFGSSLAGQAIVTRSPRPHPSSHLSGAPALIGLDGIPRSPRPHPQSHIEILSTQSR